MQVSHKNCDSWRHVHISSRGMMTIQRALRIAMTSPQLHAVAYVSRATTELGRDKLRDIVADATTFNGQNAVSGALVFDGTCFFQYIEGPPGAIADAYQRIQSSKSHVILLKLLEGPVSGRRFDGWKMFYRDGAPADIAGLNWLPDHVPDHEAKQDMVTTSLSYFWRNLQDAASELDAV
jgi:Sensors of blue-light using FAD